MLNVLFTGNKYVFRGMTLGILSILKKTEEPITFHIMTMACPWDKAEKLSKDYFDKIYDVVKILSPESKMVYYDISEDFTREFLNSPNRKPPYTPASLIRLFALRYITCDYLLYFDCDTMCYNSLSVYNDIDISNYEMGVSLDYLGRNWLKADYFNSGSMYINVKMCNETRLFERAIDYLNKKKLFFADQTALYRLSKKRLYLPMKFNEQRSVKPDTVIKHFNKGVKYLPIPRSYNVKQWQVTKVHKKLKIFEFDDIYELYDTYFNDIWPLDR